MWIVIYVENGNIKKNISDRKVSKLCCTPEVNIHRNNVDVHGNDFEDVPLWANDRYKTSISLSTQRHFFFFFTV